MVTAFGSLHPSMKVILSSAIFLSSTRSASPRSPALKSSILVTSFPPVALLSFSISDSLTLLTARIFFFAKKCWATSSIPFWHTTTLAPEPAILLAISLSIFSSSSRKAFICSGFSIFIFASTSVFSISKGEFNNAIFAPSIRRGIPV